MSVDDIIKRLSALIPDGYIRDDDGEYDDELGTIEILKTFDNDKDMVAGIKLSENVKEEGNSFVVAIPKAYGILDFTDGWFIDYNGTFPHRPTPEEVAVDMAAQYYNLSEA